MTPDDSMLPALALILGGAALAIFMIELFIPTGGVLALLCGSLGIASIIVGFLYSPSFGMILLAVYAIAAPVLIVVGLKFWARSPLGKKMILTAQDGGHTDVAQGGVVALAPIGTRLLALTALRPIGFVDFNGARCDATTETDFVDAGEWVEVTAHREGAVRVRRAKTQNPTA
ncbi:MAG: hypothetical protein DWI11_06580 [Planctomycetota bacterium]|nr:MAG: hypothetical protein DWI11_06580 [Planctomycetota bacterium]